MRSFLVKILKEKNINLIALTIAISLLFIFGSAVFTYKYIYGDNQAFYTNYNSIQTTIAPLETLLPTPTTTPTSTIIPTDAPASFYDVYFANVNGKIILRAAGNYYGQDKIPLGDNTPVNIDNASSHTWTKLTSTKDQIGPFNNNNDGIFSFRVLPDNKSFIFVENLSYYPSTNDHEVTDYETYYYNANTKSITNIIQADQLDGVDVTKIDQIDSEGKYVSFQLFGCWDCDAGQSENLILNLDTGRWEDLGALASLTLGSNGNYIYKRYILILCDANEINPCGIDPSTLPLLSG